MILQQQEINNYLQDYHNGKISMGKGIGCKDFDDNLRYKQGELTIINGLDNVGKTDFMIWYALALSMKHNIKWCIYSGENKGGQLVRKLIQYLTGEKVLEMKFSEVTRAELKIQQWFTFIDNSNFYKLEDLLKIFKDGDFNACLIDPFTGLDRGFTHSDNYNFLNTCRNFCETTNINIFVNTHVVTEAARRKYGDNQAFPGYPFPPSKSDSEGGQAFGNRPDGFLTIHRLVGHPSMNTKTMLYIRKVKDTETGSKVSSIENPVLLDFNNGLGFVINGENPLTQVIASEKIQAPIEPNNQFDSLDKSNKWDIAPF
jgi:hypothetical protein